jgi:2-aminoadipate transaminase
MLAALARYFPSEAVWNQPEGGMAIWVRLPESISARQILMQAMEQRVSFSPGEFFYSCAPRPNTLRLSFTMANPAMIGEAVRRLGAIIKARLVTAKRRPEFGREVAVKPLM